MEKIPEHGFRQKGMRQIMKCAKKIRCKIMCTGWPEGIAVGRLLRPENRKQG
jgi:hypothetical protein